MRFHQVAALRSGAGALAACAASSSRFLTRDVGAALDDPRHRRAEPVTYLVEPDARVLDHVVEERGDRLGLGAAVVEDQRGDAEGCATYGAPVPFRVWPACSCGRPFDRAGEAAGPESAARVVRADPLRQPTLRASRTFLSCSACVVAK